MLARRAREQFIKLAGAVLIELAAGIRARLNALLDQSTNARESQDRRDAWIAYQKAESPWVHGTAKAWTAAMLAPTGVSKNILSMTGFELMGNEVVENKIMSSRLALRILDKSSWELNDLMLRIRQIDGTSDTDRQDVLRPEALSHHVVEQWIAAGLNRDAWMAVQDLIHDAFGVRIAEAYHATNAFLIANGVMPDIDLRPMLRRSASAPTTTKTQELNSQDSASSPVSLPPQMSNRSPGTGNLPGSNARAPDNAAARSSASGSDGGSGAGSGGTAQYGGSATQGAQNRQNTPQGRSAASQAILDAHEETRMMTSSTPLARAKMRAQGVIGQLKRLLTDKVAGFDETRSQGPSPMLAAALAPRVARVRAGASTGVPGMGGATAGAVAGGHNIAGKGDPQAAAGHDPDDTVADQFQATILEGMAPMQVASALRQQTTQLKKAATTSSEKASIEIVALMFQSILAEDRIPAAVRVWFARLQMPVLRLALSEPEFFDSLQHPARRLIDRMGSCVLGFEADVSSAELETEIKRVVQVIEQYPETGRRVFQLVYDEFQKFLSKFLSEQTHTQKVVGVAQQVEEKETAAIQYTIEMRNMLGTMPVREEIRDYLFKVWAEVLAIAAVKYGTQHEDTINLKQVAADLVWAAAAKPNRAERARVIQDLPVLLKKLRTGMAMLGLHTERQDAHIKIISDTLADAFMSKTESVDPQQIAAMSKRLKNLEDFISEDDVGDLPLDAESIELMLGIDTSGIQIITSGGSDAGEAMRAWALELDVGSWFNIDHNGFHGRVQYAWRSKRAQLHLFALPGGRTYLFQIRRLAAYLQAGLISPIEDETLTVRATRDALHKIDANPERLLGV